MLLASHLRQLYTKPVAAELACRRRRRNNRPGVSLSHVLVKAELQGARDGRRLDSTEAAVAPFFFFFFFLFLLPPTELLAVLTMQAVPVRPLMHRPAATTAHPILISPESLLRVWDRHVPMLMDDNWQEWDSRLHNLLRPYTGVLDILTGKVQEGHAAYDLQIDIALLAIIDRKVNSEAYDVLCKLHENGNCKGSIAYQHLKKESRRPKVRHNETEEEDYYYDNY